MDTDSIENTPFSAKKPSRIHWMKLRENIFSDDSPFVYMMDKPNGYQYIVLYLRLCIMSLNTEGVLIRKIGHIIEPITEEDICKILYQMPKKLIRSGLEMLKQLCLIEIDENNIIQICDFNLMVGYESSTPEARRQREHRARQKEQPIKQSLSKEELFRIMTG